MACVLRYKTVGVMGMRHKCQTIHWALASSIIDITDSVQSVCILEESVVAAFRQRVIQLAETTEIKFSLNALGRREDPWQRTDVREGNVVLVNRGFGSERVLHDVHNDSSLIYVHGFFEKDLLSGAKLRHIFYSQIISREERWIAKCMK